MSAEQRATLDAILRQSAFPAGSDVDEQRRLLKVLLSAQPLPAEVTVIAAELGGVPVAEVTVDGIEPRHVVLYFHGGVYVMGDAFLVAELASQVGRRTEARVFSVDYRLAPEHPYPAAVDDALAAYEALLLSGIAPSDIVFAGESAGGGLAIATLVNARGHGLPLPAAAFVMSPYVDLTLSGATMETRRELDPLLSREALQARIPDYTAGQDAAFGLISPMFADLSGLPPLSIQAGSHEVLLDDAVRLARAAATADVEVTLEITPGCPTSSRPITRSSTKGPRRWTEPDGSCRGISPARSASPRSYGARSTGPGERQRGAPPRRRGPVHGGARRERRERRAAEHPARRRLLRAEPVVGAQRLHVALRRVPAARRARGRSARTSPPVHGRHRAVCGRVAGLWAVAVGGDAPDRPRRAGPRRGDGLAGGAVDHPHDVRRRQRAQPGARGLGCDRRRRWCGRVAARGRDRRGPQLALGLLRQRADRRSGAPAGAADHPRESGRGRAAATTSRAR